MAKDTLKIVIIAGIFAYLFTAIYKHASQIQNYPWRENFNSPLFLLSLFILSLYYLGYISLWKRLLRLNGDRLSFRKSFCIQIYSSMGKYLPGKIWMFVGKVYLAEQAGVGRENALLSVFLETGLIILTGLIVSFFSPVFWSVNTNRYYFSSLICASVLAPIFVFPRPFAKVLNFSLLKLGQKPIAINFSSFQLMPMGVFYLGLWGVLGIAFYLFINSIYPIPLKEYPVALGCFSFAWLAGIASLFAPAGLGVREGLLTLSLNQWLPLEIALVVSLGSRIWITLIELFCFIMASILKFLEGKSPSI